MKKATTFQKKKAPTGLPLVNPNAAGIDVGDTFHVVAVPESSDEVPVRTFGAMSCDLLSIAEWLKQCKIDTIAMESTGVYWKPLFGVLIVCRQKKVDQLFSVVREGFVGSSSCFFV